MRVSSIQFKAGFLLFVFSLSTIVGFACSVGLIMTVTDHHKKELASHQQKSHEHGKPHGHDASADHHQNTASHHENPTTHHSKQADHHKQVNNLQENTEDDCCKDEVAKFEKYDKRAPQPLNYNLQAPFLSVISNALYNIDAIAYYIHTPSNKFFVRNHHPPIADTRIAIQSFLI